MDTTVEQKTEQATDFAEVLITKVVEKLMGQTLDIMRIGFPVANPDRQFNQAERNTRQNFNTAREYMIKTLKENGYMRGVSNGTH